MNKLISNLRHFAWLAATIAALVATTPKAQAQAGLPIYTDHLVNAFEDWSWAARNLANTAPVYSGANSISVTANTWEAISFHHSDFDTTIYTNLSFWANGGSGGGQRLQVYAEYGAGVSGPAYVLPTALITTWKQYVVPLSTLGVANKSNVNRFTIQLTASGTTGTFYVDDIQLAARPAPALVQLSVNATQSVRSVDARWFGVNTAIWDGNYDPPQRTTTISLLKEMACLTLRCPGGSLSDEYHWASNTTLTNSWQWQTSFADFVAVATNVGAQVFVTVNYGTGTPGEAAAWVRHANVTNNYAFKYWEIGNENYGTWETDTNTFPHDAYTYAVRATNYLAQMKAADPTIKVGVVVAPGEDSYMNGYTNHPAYNPRTGQTHNGWTPVLLTTLKNLGVPPDFLVHHVYPQYIAESDPLLLQSTVNWARDAADLRQQIRDYFGPAGTNIELVCTENNSDASASGWQTTSLVNGLYYADSLSQLMKTEFNSFIWWDLRNGTDTSGSPDPLLYGWRTYGDLGMINGLGTKHPAFYAAKLMQYFARPGDNILSASSDYPLLSACASRRASGAVTLLVLNKDTLTNFNAQISLNGFSPGSAATIRSFGVPQDEAARTNGTAQAQDISTNNFAGAGTNFSYNFSPLSLTLFTLAPAAPRLFALPAAVQPSGQFVFQLQGQPAVRYFIQNSTNLSVWTTVSTNTLFGNTLNLTNPAPADSSLKFWRAMWQP